MTPPPGLMLLTIPSPSWNSIDIGPLTINAYGLCIGLGVLAAVTLAARRWEARGGRAEDVFDVTLWAVPAGLVGARIYHIINDWRPWREWLQVWNGGLGIGGGLIAGIAVGYLVAKRRGFDTAAMIDAAVPAIPIGQAIGRFGNWFNQENFGTPTDLPWALAIDPPYRPPGYEQFATFHPAFLYEAIWNVALMGVLIGIDRRRVVPPGMMLPLYAAGYSIGRVLIESLRTDPAPEYLGLRFNVWVYGVAAVLGLIWVAVARSRAEPAG